MPLSIQQLETETLLNAINSINSFIQLKDKDAQASTYQVALLKLAYSSLHELNHTLSGNSSEWAKGKMQEALDEMNTTISSQNDKDFFSTWVWPENQEEDEKPLDEVQFLDLLDEVKFR
jgi:hypothetical protein